MKKIFIIAIIISLGALYASAENNMPKSQLHMKSGELVTGNITTRTSTSVTIAIDGNEYSYSTNEIAYITHEAKKKNYNTQRFRGFIDFGYGLGIGSPRNNVFLIETSFGYQFSHYLYVGGGLGVNFHKADLDSYPWRQDKGEVAPTRNDPDWKFPFIPIYLNIRSQLYEGNRFTPYADLKIGASILNYYGFFMSPSIGIHIPTASFLALNIGVGYTMQQAHYKLWTRGETPGAIPDGSGSSYLNKNILLSSVSLKIGLEF
ncbi:MAG: hypothetical protein PHR45_03590 [Muribaculaceae bacterium]|nr:hypothetical protein [Muribaculaceae bacterium]